MSERMLSHLVLTWFGGFNEGVDFLWSVGLGSSPKGEWNAYRFVRQLYQLAFIILLIF